MATYTTEVQQAEFDENGLAIIEGWADVFLCHSQTREFLGKSYDRVPRGFSVVADAYLDEPKLPESGNMAVICSPDGKSWIHVPDYRGKTAYHMGTRQKIEINYLDEIRPDHTLLAPTTQFDSWNGEKWVTDTTEQYQHEVQQAENQRQALLQDAERQLILLERKKRS
ncbi:tail fiber assembly protein [Xenorhabdus bovienii]|uniref:Tail fiber assembly protein n=1 Tax=Xenorhabdus bovienii str. Intermedium TaxID=1379677 RepID=A0A077QLH2_XENBV|nr:tail fiber assembly protein [Xenorhabdus bovienii]CDH34180.1 conserved hypothetical protein [Xenorhabdus bovienii str. Intermedium]